MVANLIPGFGHGDGLVGNLKVLGEEFLFNARVLQLEAFASGSLLVAIATKVNSLVAFAKGSLAELAIGKTDVVGGQIGAGSAGIRHYCSEDDLR